MQCRELIELAVTLAERADVITGYHPRLSERHLQQYWVASRGLLNSWGLTLRRCTEQLEQTDYESDSIWLRWTPALEEILIAEMQTRLWACLLEECDRRSGLHEYSPVGRSIFTGHLDLRRRILQVLLKGRQLSVFPVWRLNRTRISVERWTDLLLRSLPTDGNIHTYCFDRHRTEDQRPTQQQSAALRGAVIRAAAREDLAFSGEVETEREGMHRSCQAAILGAWASAAFQDVGPMVSAWQARLVGLTDDTQGLLQQLWATGQEGANMDRDRLPRRFSS